MKLVIRDSSIDDVLELYLEVTERGSIAVMSKRRGAAALTEFLIYPSGKWAGCKGGNLLQQRGF